MKLITPAKRWDFLKSLKRGGSIECLLSANGATNAYRMAKKRGLIVEVHMTEPGAYRITRVE
jgi:hypothetical protein